MKFLSFRYYSGDMENSYFIRHNVRKVAEYGNTGWTLNINNYTLCDIPSKLQFTFSVYEDLDDDCAYIFPVTLIETIYFLFIPVWKIYYAKYLAKIPKEALEDKYLPSKIFDLIYHGYTDMTFNGITYPCVSKEALKYNSKHCVQLLHRDEGYPSLIFDYRNVAYYDAGKDRIPSGDSTFVINFKQE